MQRLDFLKNLGLATTVGLLPNPFFESKPVKIYDNYIRGLSHYDFKKLKPTLKEGDTLSLVREQDNIYDAFAVQVNVNQLRLGYIAAYENICIANMLEQGVKLTAFVSKYDKQASIHDEQIAVEIFADLIVATPKLITRLNQNTRADDAPDVYRGDYE